MAVKPLTKYSMPKRQAKKKRPSKRTSNYRSGFEAKLANQLQRSGVEFQYETLQLEYKKVSTYTPDFILPNGIIIEAKGLWVTEDRTKHLLIREQHPHLDIRMVFMNAANKIRKGSSTSYAHWCEKKGIKYANKVIPKSWLSSKHINPVTSVGQVMHEPSTTTEAPIVSVAKIIVDEVEDNA
jgi:hypothetical protein